MKQNLLMPLLCLNSGTGETMSRKPKRQGLDKAADKSLGDLIQEQKLDKRYDREHSAKRQSAWRLKKVRVP
jgi:hypothetical protein